ncbi:hypothetical protein QR680_000447 [Steinernema hermaphroditum]|uniref:Uncharacterized protein n=1 Tax=Steinernema hermaphroditum TaxID=289476 RepID=A0AA39GUT7_9BILA|nr:hypothetical protein QR680_000447 [Steinernema hermaphroditum]
MRGFLFSIVLYFTVTVLILLIFSATSSINRFCGAPGIDLQREDRSTMPFGVICHFVMFSKDTAIWESSNCSLFIAGS